MDKGGSAPTAPDYTKLIGLQTGANRDSFNYQTDASHINSVTPTGSSTWSNNPTFDQSGYDAAMAKWNNANSKGTWVPGGMTTAGGSGDGSSGPTETGGYWDGATSDGTAAPDRAAFTHNNYTNTQAYTPEMQALFDANNGVKTQIAGTLSGLGADAVASLNKPLDLSGAPALSSGVTAAHSDTFNPANYKNMDTLDASSLPTYQQFAGAGTQTGAKYGDINRMGFGAGPEAYQKTADPAAYQRSASPTNGIRDWGGALMPAVGGLSNKLASRDPFQYYQQGADAAYNKQKTYLEPEQAQQLQKLESRLGEQGFVPGTPAYNQALQEQLDTQNRAYSDARDSAILEGQRGGSEAYSNETTALNDAISRLLQGGQLGLDTDTAHQKASQDIADFGQKDNLNAFNSGLDVANFRKSDNLNAATNSLDIAKFGDARQNQDFNQQKDIAGMRFNEGESSNKALQANFDNSNTTTTNNNALATKDFTNLQDLTGFNNAAHQGDVNNLSTIYNYNRNANNDNNAADIAAGTFNNSARTQYRNEGTQDANAPLMRLMQALGLTQPGALPGVTTAQTPNLQTPDALAAAGTNYNNQVNAYSANNSSNNALFGQIAQFLPYLFMPSDNRLKTDIEHVGQTSAGVPIYNFSYKPEFALGEGRFRGVMAQDLITAGQEDAVRLNEDGFYSVDYSKVQ